MHVLYHKDAFLNYLKDNFYCVSHSGEEDTPSWSTYVGKMFTAASSYLPAQVSGMMSQDRAFATVRLQMAGQKNVCALAT